MYKTSIRAFVLLCSIAILGMCSKHYQQYNVRMNTLEIHSPNSNYYNNGTKTDTLDFRNSQPFYAWEFNLDYSGMVIDSTRIKEKTASSGFSLFPILQAAQPSDEYILDHNFRNIRIITLYDYDSTHLAGSDVSDLFIFDARRYFGNSMDSTLMELNQSLLGGYPGARLTAFLNAKPEQDTVHQFTFKTLFSDRREVVGSTPVILISTKNDSIF